jgi:hypothetical protein
MMTPEGMRPDESYLDIFPTIMITARDCLDVRVDKRNADSVSLGTIVNRKGRFWAGWSWWFLREIGVLDNIRDEDTLLER